ncbi:hypothetical protein LXM25_05740 [Dyadobacter sp. LJ53]|uniref:hypothetical protein n=1 Tax=Dyadobacter chenwenxiniae TaxID=2906456 RepID=UPI001F1616CD|nr:hypothetical protein [Dyadobacter chenwenxiniae]MCF0049545.1 hypothetical protein [Dyadobacter chenwenxiniae]
MYLKEKFGSSEVLIIAKELDGPVTLINKSPDQMGGFNMESTSGFTDKIDDLKKIVKDLAQSFGDEMNSMNNTLNSSSISLEFTLTLSQGGWIIGLESEQSIKLKIDWKSPQ